MCTLIVGFYPETNSPLIVGANRDENPTRPSEGWEQRGNVFCPLDVRGGTWIGCNDEKMFCAITNWDMDKEFPVRRSRGDIVLNSLRCTSPEEAIWGWSTMKATDYRPFNLLLGNDKQLWNLSCDGEKATINSLGPGLHISTGWGLNILPPREAYVRKYLQEAFRDFSQPVSSVAVKEVLSHHNAKGDDSVCVHDRNHEWETVSSAHLRLYNDRWTVENCSGPPCEIDLDEWNVSKFETKLVI